MYCDNMKKGQSDNKHNRFHSFSISIFFGIMLLLVNIVGETTALAFQAPHILQVSST